MLLFGWATSHRCGGLREDFISGPTHEQDSLVGAMSDLPAMTEKHGSRGFMTWGGHILGFVFMIVIYPLLAAVLSRWIDSRALLIVVLVLLFLPVFVALHGLADVLTTLDSREEREEEERRRKARHLSRRGQKKQRSRRRND